MCSKNRPNPKASSASALLQAAVDYYGRFGISIRRLLTDNGPGNRSASFRPFVTGSASANLSLGPSTPPAQWQSRHLRNKLPVWISTTKMVVRDLDGKIIGTFGVSRDITKSKHAEQELQLAKQNLENRVAERTSELAQANEQLEIELAERKRAEEQVRRLNENLEHRVAERTVQLVAANRQLGPEAQELLKLVQEGSQKMDLMIDDLLNLARLDRREAVSKMTALNSLVEVVLKDLKSEIDGRSVDWHVGLLPAVNCDPGLLQQAFANLLSNAVKYTRGRERAVIEVGQMTINGEVVIYVRDNGAGFDSKHASKLFGAFQRLHTSEEFEGTGVGLATVQRIIRKHGGRVWAEAEQDKGATFYFTLCEKP